MDEDNIGQFGHARFPQSKKGFLTTIDCFGVIKSADKKYVLFEDNDNYQYLVSKKDFKFEKCEFKEKTK